LGKNVPATKSDARIFIVVDFVGSTESRPTGKDGNLLSGPELSLSFAAYAEARFSQQNKESRQETVQDHSERQSFAFAILAPASHVIQERQAQTAVEQNGAGGPYGRCTNQSEPPIRLKM